MKKTSLLLSVVTLLLLSSCKKDLLKVSTIETNVISSTFTGETYKIQVLLPEDYSSGAAYPVVYLLDGYYHFNDVANQKIRSVEAGDMRDIILVSIEYDGVGIKAISDLTKIEDLRTIDLTYPADAESAGGGALLFYDFLKYELIPLIQKNYTTTGANKRTLLGHSLAGFFSIFQTINFATDPLFENVVAASPSIWWAEFELLKKEQNAHDNAVSIPVNLYLSMGELEGVLMNAPYDEFVAKLTEHNIDLLIFTSKKYTKGHRTNAEISMSNALKTIY